MHTRNLSFVILFVADVPTSARFYADLLGSEPAEQSPGFAAFPLPSGLTLGLWATKTATPAVTASPGASELTFTEADVDAVHRAWVKKGLRIVAPPADLELGADVPRARSRRPPAAGLQTRGALTPPATPGRRPTVSRSGGGHRAPRRPGRWAGPNQLGFLGTRSATGKPALLHAANPPSISTTRSSPICWAVSAASAERHAPLQ
jgi:catechol 2,3-dioxygenase-like lactoylglutathione lyase family enzyme